MMPLIAATVTQLYKAKNDTTVTILSDSATITRLAKSSSTLETTNGGIGLTCYTPLHVRFKALQILYGISAGTPNITVLDEDEDYKVVS